MTKVIYLCLMRKTSIPGLVCKGKKEVPCPNCGEACWQTDMSRKTAKALSAQGYEVKEWCSLCSR